MKCGKQGYFTKDYKGSQQNHTVKCINTLQDYNRVKAIRESLIKHFTFYYNSVYKVYKNAKYIVG